MRNECSRCPGFMTGTCKKRTYNSEECKKRRDEYTKKQIEYLETHCIHCGKRKDVVDGGDIIIEIGNKYFSKNANVIGTPRHMATLLEKLQTELLTKIYKNNLEDKAKIDKAGKKAGDKRMGKSNSKEA